MADGIQVTGMNLRQRLRDAPMQKPPVAGADLGVRHLADLVVAKVVGFPATLAHQEPLPQGVQVARDGIFITLARSCQHRKREGAADRGRQAGQFPGRGW